MKFIVTITAGERFVVDAKDQREAMVEAMNYRERGYGEWVTEIESALTNITVELPSLGTDK